MTNIEQAISRAKGQAAATARTDNSNNKGESKR
jgi:hypothetical protein